MEHGEWIERSLDEIHEDRNELVDQYRKLIRTDEDRDSFDSARSDTRVIYKYADDHLFWIEH